MTKIKLESIGVEFEAPEVQSYTFCGEVKSVLMVKIKEVILKHWKEPRKYNRIAQTMLWSASAKLHGQALLGICISSDPWYSLRSALEFKVKTYIQKGMPEPEATFVWGHEETHALANFGRFDLIESRYPDYFAKENSENMPKNGEDMANLGGVIAVSRKYGEEGLKRILRELELPAVSDDIMFRRFVMAQINKGGRIYHDNNKV